MTVNVDNLITSGPYVGTGLVDEYDYTFKVESKTDLQVFETNALGVVTTLTVDTDYTVNDIGNEDGGTVTRLDGALPTGYEWYIRSNYSPTQLTDFDSQGGFFPEVHEASFDKLTYLVKQYLDTVGRSVRLADSDSDSTLSPLPLKSTLPGKVLRFDLSGNPSAVNPSEIISALMSDAAVFNDVAALQFNTDANVTKAFVFADGYGWWKFDTDDTITVDNGVTAVVDAQSPRTGTWKKIVSNIVNTVADLKLSQSTNLINGQFVQTLGYITPGDGGHGIYKWTAGSSQTVDNFLVHQLTAGGDGRFFLQYDSKLNPRVAGALGNGVNDDLLPIQRTINAMQAIGVAGCIEFNSGNYFISDQLVVTSACTLTSNSITPLINYPGLSQGGAIINFQKTISGAITDPSSFALKIDTGSLGSEGYANCKVTKLGFISNHPKAGSVYVEGALGVRIEENWFANNQSNYDSGTTTAIGIYCRDMIESNITNNTFRRFKWGIYADYKFNENVIEKNKFENGIGAYIVISGDNLADSVRNSITDNNFIGDGIVVNYPPNAIVIVGQTSGTTISANTLEIIKGTSILVTNVDPVTGSTLPSTSSGTVVKDNMFLACNAAFGGATVSFGNCVGGAVCNNTVYEPTGPMTSLVNVASSVSDGVYISENFTAGKPIVSGDPTKTFLQTLNYIKLKPNTNDTFASIFNSDYAGANWFNNTDKILKLWNGTEICNVKSGGQISINSASTTTTTYTVRGASSVQMSPTGSHTVTNITDGTIGQKVIFYNNSGTFTVTFQHNTNLRMKAGANVVLAGDQYIVLERITATRWVEVA